MSFFSLTIQANDNKNQGFCFRKFPDSTLPFENHITNLCRNKSITIRVNNLHFSGYYERYFGLSRKQQLQLKYWIGSASRNMRTKLSGTETVSNLVAKISPPTASLRIASSWQIFKNNVNKWKPKILHVGFVRNTFKTSALST